MSSGTILSAFGRDTAERTHFPNRYGGRELSGKTLGVVGLGAIGAAVLKAALALGMKVVGFDPALSVDAALKLPGNKMTMVDSLEELAAASDYVTLHAPFNAHTKELINADVLSKMKSDACVPVCPGRRPGGFRAGAS